MIFWAVIIGIELIAIIDCIKLNREGEPYSWGFFCGWTTFALIVLEIMCICEIVSEPLPKAIDVYQGKTTLEYTIVDGVKVDSVVVFKDNYDKK